MTEWMASQLAVWGTPLLFIATFLSCLAVPVPTSLMMLTAGAFAAAGDLALMWIAISAYVGAILGDQTGFMVGRYGGPRLLAHLEKRPKRAALVKQARDLTDKHGGLGVFLSRWLFSPLGPYANLAGGLVGMSRLRFSLWGAAGEAVWVTLYIGLGYAFADQIAATAQLASDLSGLLAAAAVALGMGLWLRKLWRGTKI